MPGTTLAEIRSEIYSQIDWNTDFWPEAEVTRAINEAIRTLNLFLGFYQTTATILTQANRVFYDVPGTILIPLAVDLANRQLKRNSIPLVANQLREWMKHTSAARARTSEWIPIGIRKIALHPAESVAGRNLRITGVAEPVPLVSVTDIVHIQDELIDPVKHLAILALQFKEGGKVFADGSLNYQEFLGHVKEWERWKSVKHPRYFVEKEAVKVA